MKHFLQVLSFLSITAVVGCGSPRTITAVPGNPTVKSSPSSAPGFSLTVAQPASVPSPPPCPGCIGEATDGSTVLSIQITSTAYSGPVQLSVAGLPVDVAFVQLIPSVTLNYGEPQTVTVTVYVLPAAAPGAYRFTVSALGDGSAVALTLPVTLTITSGASSSWGAN